jgi:hypothetical protein
MRVAARLALVALPLWLAGQAAALPFQDKGKPEPAGKAGLTLPFPDVKGWHRTEPRKFPQEEAGYSLGYNSADGVVVTVYVYNRGLAQIPSGVASEAVRQEFQKTKDALYEVEKLGIYKAVREEQSGEAKLGGEKGTTRTLHARFRMKVKEQDVGTEVRLFAYRNHFIKLRATWSADRQGMSLQTLAGLYSQLDAMFAKWREANKTHSSTRRHGMMGRSHSPRRCHGSPVLSACRRGPVRRRYCSGASSVPTRTLQRIHGEARRPR